MQSQASAREYPANAATTLIHGPPVDGPLNERQMSELREVWLEHQVNPPGEIERRGVSYSALND